MATKRPSFQFYPADWLRDPVSGCSLAAQGLWLRLMFLMHDSERYGYLCQNGLPIPPEQLARRVGCQPDEFNALLAELESAGIPGCTKDSIIYSRRMVRDAEERVRDADRKRKSYRSNEKKSNKTISGDSPGNLRRFSGDSHTPSSSSSSSSSSLGEVSPKTPRERAPPNRFVKPTPEEINAYCQERGNSVDAQQFFDHYEANGWKVGKASMKDWRAAVRTWEKNGIRNGKQAKTQAERDASWELYKEPNP